MSLQHTIAREHHWLNKNRILRWSWALLVLFLIITTFFIKSNFLSDSESAKPARDYIAFWSASRLALNGSPELAYDSKELHKVSRSAVENAPNFHWLYPPTYQALILPAALLKYDESFFTFISISFSAFLIAALRLAKKIPIIPILAFPAIYTVFFFGQNSFLTTALIILALTNIINKPNLAGLAIGILTIKPHLAIVLFIALIAGRYWHVLITSILFSFIIAYLSYLILGSDVWIKFATTPEIATQLLEDHKLSWDYMTSIYVSSRILGASNALAYLIHFIFSTIIMVVMIIIWRKYKNIDLKYSIAALATLTFSPYMFDYELIILCIPIVLLIKHSIRNGWMKWERETYTAAWIFPLINFILPDIGGTEISFTPIIVIALTICIIRRLSINEKK